MSEYLNKVKNFYINGYYFFSHNIYSLSFILFKYIYHKYKKGELPKVLQILYYLIYK